MTRCTTACSSWLTTRATLVALVPVALAALFGAACGPVPLRKTLRDEVADEIKRVRPTLARCYTIALRKNELLKGGVEVGFDISAAGDFQNVNVTATTLKAPAMTQCIQQALAGLGLFQPAGRPVSVTLPLTFVQAPVKGLGSGKSKLQSAPLDAKPPPGVGDDTSATPPPDKRPRGKRRRRRKRRRER